MFRFHKNPCRTVIRWHSVELSSAWPLKLSLWSKWNQKLRGKCLEIPQTRPDSLRPGRLPLRWASRTRPRMLFFCISCLCAKQVQILPKKLCLCFRFLPTCTDARVKMILTVVLLGIATLYVVVKLLRLTSPSEVPHLYYNRSRFNQDVLQMCPILQEPWVFSLLVIEVSYEYARARVYSRLYSGQHEVSDCKSWEGQYVELAHLLLSEWPIIHSVSVAKHAERHLFWHYLVRCTRRISFLSASRTSKVKPLTSFFVNLRFQDLRQRHFL